MARPLKILFADDEEGWRQLVSFWLERAGYEIQVASEGKGVLALARKSQPDCFLLDHDLGDTTGRELCRAIKSQPEFRAIPVVILTANAEVLPQVVADLPPDHFVAKSKHPDELLLILDGLLPRPA